MYQRNGRMSNPTEETPTPPQNGVKVNGYQQVIELLTYADAEFRISLLKRITKQNPKLGQMLYQELVIQGVFRDS